MRNCPTIPELIDRFMLRPTWRDQPMEYWLENIFPQGIARMQERFDEEAKPHLNRLSLALEQPELAHRRLADPQLEVDLEGVADQLRADRTTLDRKGLEAYRQLNVLKLQYDKAERQGRVFQERLLPRLQELRRGGEVEADDARLIRDVFLNTEQHALAQAGAVGKAHNIISLYREYAPPDMQADDPRAAGDTFYGMLGQLSGLLMMGGGAWSARSGPDARSPRNSNPPGGLG